MRGILANAPAGVAALSLVLAVACSTAGPPTAQKPRKPVEDSTAATMIAEIALERGDCRTAAENYARAALDGDASLARRASQVALACEHLPAAWDAVSRWRELDPADTDAAATYAVVALKLYQIEDAREAVTALVQSAKDEPSDERLVEVIALLLEDSDPATVLEAVSGALDSSTLSADMLALLGDLALQAYNVAQAEGYAREALRSDSESLPAKRVLARVFVMKGDAQSAIATAQEVTREGDVRDSFELSEVLTALDRLEEARQELERLHGTDAPIVEVERRLAMLAYRGGDFVEARRRLLDLAESGEASESALFYLSDIAARAGHDDVALAGFRRLADSSSLAIAARSRAAALLMKRGDRAEALSLLDDYAAEHPQNSFELLIVKAHLLADHGEADSGAALLAAGLERHPRHPSLQYDRAVILERAGRIDESLAILEDLLDRRPGDPTLLNALGYTMADHGKDLERAENLIRRALESAPDNPAMLDSLGWALFRQGDAQAAEPILARAHEIARDPEIAAHWGEVLWASGDQNEARKVWASALARNPDAPVLKETLARLLPAPPESSVEPQTDESGEGVIPTPPNLEAAPEPAARTSTPRGSTVSGLWV